MPSVFHLVRFAINGRLLKAIGLFVTAMLIAANGSVAHGQNRKPKQTKSNSAKEKTSPRPKDSIVWFAVPNAVEQPASWLKPFADGSRGPGRNLIDAEDQEIFKDVIDKAPDYAAQVTDLIARTTHIHSDLDVGLQSTLHGKPFRLDEWKNTQWQDSLLTSCVGAAGKIKYEDAYNALINIRFARIRALEFHLSSIREARSDDDLGRRKRAELQTKMVSHGWYDLSRGMIREVDSSRTDVIESLVSNGSKAYRGAGWKAKKYFATADEISNALPATAVLLDVHRYFSKTKLVHCYCAFVVSSSQDGKSNNTIQLVDLGSASELEIAIADWVRELQAGRTATQHGNTIFRQLWQPISKCFTVSPERLYVRCDGVMRLVPWHAIPVDNGNAILLEKMEVAQLGLPQELVVDRKASDDRKPALAPPQVANDLALICDTASRPGTSLSENAKALKAFEKDKVVRVLSGSAATPRNVQVELENCRVAIFETHSSKERGKTPKTEVDPFGLVGLFQKNEVDGLILTGIHLAGEESSTELCDQVLSSEMISGLDCQSLQAAVLSGCFAEVCGIDRFECSHSVVNGFRLAGCQNIVSTSWNTDDETTSRINQEFLRRHVIEGEAPIAALRQAQLKIYRETVSSVGAVESSGNGQTMPVRRPKPYAWAAFVLTGTGETTSPSTTLSASQRFNRQLLPVPSTLLPPRQESGLPPQLLANQPGANGQTPFGKNAFANEHDLARIIKSAPTSEPADIVYQLLDLTTSRKSVFSTSIFDVTDEFAFEAKPIATLQRWRDALLTYSHKAKSVNQIAVYDALLAKRATAMRSLMMTLNALRRSDPDIDPEKSVRNELRAKITELAWEGAINNSQAKTIADHRAKIRSSLNEVGGQLHTAIGSSQGEQSVYAATTHDLLTDLAASTALIDIYRYEDISAPPAGNGGGTAKYCAYITSTSAKNEKQSSPDFLSPTTIRTGPATDARLIRIELGAANEIESAIEAWLRELRAQRDGKAQASKVSELVWTPIAKAFSASPRTIYISASGPLERLPWAAIPVNGGEKILLEEMQIGRLPFPQFVIKPHDSFDRGGLSEFTINDLLVVGDIDPKGLPEASRETEAIVTLAKNLKKKILRGPQASPAAVSKELEHCKVAVFSLHGSQSTAALRTAQQSGALRTTMTNELDGLLYAALHLGTENADDSLARRLLVADAVTEINCRDVELVVLSACATARGSTAPGEPSLSMAQSFHCAGAQNVVSTLWEVDDAGTRAIIEEFFRQYWVEKKAPIEAMRQAQLHVYRQGIVFTGSSARDPLDLKNTKSIEKKNTGGNSHQSGKTSPHIWAGFILSGTGS